MANLLNIASIISANKQKDRVAQLQFPSDLGDYYMILEFRTYKYSTAISNTQGRVGDSIALPLPENFLDSSRIEVGGRQIGTLGQVAADLATGVKDLRKGVSSVGELLSGAAQVGANLVAGTGAFLGDVGGAMQGKAGAGDAAIDKLEAGLSGVADYGSYAVRGFASKLAPGVAQGLGAAVGNAMNPHATLVFDGVDLKIHNFSWKFAPRNEAEAATLNQIINKIQYYIHPEYRSVVQNETGIQAVDRGLLTYPALMSVKLRGVNENYIINFNKYMMVNQFNVDYTPGGFSVNRGGKPAFINCSMNVVESQIRTKSDYEGNALGVTLGQTGGLTPTTDTPQDTVQATSNPNQSTSTTNTGRNLNASNTDAAYLNYLASTEGSS